MTHYKLGGTINVDLQNTRSIIKGQITNDVLYYFFIVTQDPKNNNVYFQNIHCN